MSNSNFVDYIKIHCKSGNGGAGSAHLRREKFVPKGGPDGGDGGRGGHVILKANRQLWTLLHLRYTKHIKATHGENGGKQRSFGANGEDKYVEVPLGTIVKDEDGNFEGELTEDGQELIIMKGGRGGQGNYHFKSATNQTPRYAQSGEEGKEGWKILELKLLADVGLVGFPNAGKSTLLSTISAAKPKIGDYPFTTLRPNLGIIPYRDHRSFVMADIPGIIEGAHEGKGLGLRFLRHIERNSVLLFVISIETDSIKTEFEILLNELQKYNPELMDKSKILAISKSDILDDEMIKDLEKELPKNIKYVFISSVSNKGINKLKDMLWEEIIKPI